MNSAETIIAINADPHAQIFSVAHYAVIGDIYEILPEMIARIKAEKINNRNIYA